MKGVVLAGGTGSRLRPITHTGPKQLIPIANKPVIDYAIEDLADAGITEIAVVLGNIGRKAIQNHLVDGSEFDVNITYIIQGKPLGLAHAVGCTRDFVGDEPFIVYLGDNMMRGGISELVDDFDPTVYSAGIGLQEVDEPSRFGIVGIDPKNGNITELVEKPDDPPSNLALIGVYVLTSEIFEQIESLEPSWRGELEITEAIQGLLDDGQKIDSHVVEGWWKDTGKPEDVLHANRLVLDDIQTNIEGTIEGEEKIQGRVELGSGSIVKSGAVVRGPVSIGNESKIGKDAYIGPYTSIGDRCRVDNVHLESSVVIGDSKITCGKKIIDSLLGKGSNIDNNNGTKPLGARLVIGENSSLEL